MKKLKLRERLTRILQNSSEVYFSKGDVLISDCIGLIDNRTRFDFGSNVNVVKPFCFIKGFYGYICPDCGGVHFSSESGKIPTGCCLDIDCQRHFYIGGEHFLIQGKPIVLDDGC